MKFMKLKKPDTKRKAVDHTKAKLFLVVAAASAFSVFCLVASKSYLSQAGYLNRVAGAKEETLDQLKKNKTAVTSLVAAYKTFSSSDPNLLGGAKAGNGERDGDNGKLVLDAMPSKYDLPALASSLEKPLKGYPIDTITGTDDSANQANNTSATTSGAVEIPFTVDASAANFKAMEGLVLSFERSIRPFQFTAFEIQAGSGDSVKGVVTAKTFYQPEKSLQLGKKVVK